MDTTIPNPQIDTEFARALAQRITLAKGLLQHLQSQIGPDIEKLPNSFLVSLDLERYERIETLLLQLADALRAFGGDPVAIQRMESLAEDDIRRKRWEVHKVTRLGFTSEACTALAEAVDTVLQSLPTIWVLYDAFQVIPDCLSGTPELWSGDLQILPEDLREAANIALWQVFAVDFLGNLGRWLKFLSEQSFDGFDLSATPPSICGYELSLEFISRIRQRVERVLRSLQQRASVLESALLAEHSLAALEVSIVGDNDAQTAHQLAKRLCEQAADSLERLAHEPIRKFLSRIPVHGEAASNTREAGAKEILDALCQLPQFDHVMLVRAIKREASRVTARRAERTLQQTQATMAAGTSTNNLASTPTENDVLDPVTLAQAATLVHKQTQTLYNASKRAPYPKAAMAGHGSICAVWRYADLRPWLLELWPEMEYRLPLDYAEAKSLFAQTA